MKECLRQNEKKKVLKKKTRKRLPSYAIGDNSELFIDGSLVKKEDCYDKSRSGG